MISFVTLWPIRGSLALFHYRRLLVQESIYPVISRFILFHVYEEWSSLLLFFVGNVLMDIFFFKVQGKETLPSHPVHRYFSFSVTYSVLTPSLRRSESFHTPSKEVIRVPVLQSTDPESRTRDSVPRGHGSMTPTDPRTGDPNFGLDWRRKRGYTTSLPYLLFDGSPLSCEPYRTEEVQIIKVVTVTSCVPRTSCSSFPRHKIRNLKIPRSM